MHFPVVTNVQHSSMQQPASEFEIINEPAGFEDPEEVTDYFSLTATSNTRLGRKTAQEDEITAPMILKRLTYPFVLCEVTVSADLQNDWDQGGLAIFAGGHPGQTRINQLRNPSLRRADILNGHRSNSGPMKWARVALEMNVGELNISTLVANPECGVDWASTPAFPSSHSDDLDSSIPSVRLKLERVGSDLWVWFMVPEAPMHLNSTSAPTPEAISRRWRKCREIINFFDPYSAKGGVWIGCYASRPVEADMVDDCPHHEDGLFVEFEDLEIL